MQYNNNIITTTVLLTCIHRLYTEYFSEYYIYEKSASPVSQTVTVLVRPDKSHVTKDSPVLLSQIDGSQTSSSNGDGFKVALGR